MYYKKINLFILLLFCFASLFVNAEELEINISQGNIKPTPIAITDFFSKDLKSAKVGKDISAVIANNLERSGLFIPLDKKALTDDQAITIETVNDFGYQGRNDFLVAPNSKFPIKPLERFGYDYFLNNQNTFTPYFFSNSIPSWWSLTIG